MLALLACLTLATSVMGIAVKLEHVNTTLAKKNFEDAQYTWFDVGLSACGGYN